MVFSCPDCRTDVTISRYQAAGELPILCARCNQRYQVQGQLLVNPAAVGFLHAERYLEGKATPYGVGYKVFAAWTRSRRPRPCPRIPSCW